MRTDGCWAGKNSCMLLDMIASTLVHRHEVLLTWLTCLLWALWLQWRISKAYLRVSFSFQLGWAWNVVVFCCQINSQLSVSLLQHQNFLHAGYETTIPLLSWQYCVLNPSASCPSPTVGLFRASIRAFHVGVGSICLSHSFNSSLRHSRGSVNCTFRRSRVFLGTLNWRPILHHLVLAVWIFSSTVIRSPGFNSMSAIT